MSSLDKLSLTVQLDLKNFTQLQANAAEDWLLM